MEIEPEQIHWFCELQTRACTAAAHFPLFTVFVEEDETHVWIGASRNKSNLNKEGKFGSGLIWIHPLSLARSRSCPPTVIQIWFNTSRISLLPKMTRKGGEKGGFMNWMSSQTLCHMHSDSAERKDIKREKRLRVCVLHSRTGAADQCSSNNSSKQRYGSACWHARQPHSLAERECVCICCHLVQLQCVCVTLWGMRAEQSRSESSFARDPVSRVITPSWAAVGLCVCVLESGFFHFLPFFCYITFKYDMQVHKTGSLFTAFVSPQINKPLLI